MIQTDKPVYKPGESVRYQIMAMDGTTKPIKLEEIEVEVFDGNENLVSSDNTRRIKWNNYGFYESEFALAEEPALGVFTIKVKINEQNLETTNTFRVERYSLPPFKVFIETNPRVSLREKVIRFEVFAKYSFDKFVKGKAKVTARVFSESNPSSELSKYEKLEMIQDEDTTMTIKLKEDLKISFAVQNLVVTLDVEFEEENTGITAIASQQVLVFPQGKHIISLKKQQNLRPGFPYTIDVFVTTADGLPEKSTSIPLTMSLRYVYKTPPRTPELITETAFLKQGKAKFVLEPSEEVTSAEITFNYDEVTIREEVIALKSRSNSNEYMQLVVMTEK